MNEASKKLMDTQNRYASQEPLDRSVLSSWTLRLSKLQERSGHLAKLLILWGILDNRDIWYEFLTPALTPLNNDRDPSLEITNHILVNVYRHQRKLVDVGLWADMQL